LPKTGLATAAIVIAALVMVLLPYSFTMSARGIIQPVQRHEIYARTEGLVTEIPLPNQQNVMVQAGQRLIATTNRDLDAEYLSLIGKMEETKELFQEKERSERLLTDRLEKMKINAEIQLLRSDYNTMWERAKIVLDKREQLHIDSPIDGQIINWNLRQTLMGRWLLGGERLMTVVDLNGPWELELYLPERGAAHVLRQVRESEAPVEVTFQLASQPGETYRGTIAQIDQRAEVHEVHGNSIRVLVRFDDQQVPEFLRRPGTGVTAKIHCGQRPLGYVLFREVWETVQAQVLFWL
jgi:multidrug resistance efflux pump